MSDLVEVFQKLSLAMGKTKISVNNFKIVSDKVSFKMNKSQKSIVSLIRDNPNITINRIMLHTSLSEPGVKKNLKLLKDKGYIGRIGANKNGYWKVLD